MGHLAKMCNGDYPGADYDTMCSVKTILSPYVRIPHPGGLPSRVTIAAGARLSPFITGSLRGVLTRSDHEPRGLRRHVCFSSFRTLRSVLKYLVLDAQCFTLGALHLVLLVRYAARPREDELSNEEEARDQESDEDADVVLLLVRVRARVAVGQARARRYFWC